MPSNIRDRITRLAEGTGMTYSMASDIGRLAERFEEDNPGSEVGFQITSTSKGTELNLTFKLVHANERR